jgi:hypothetical protein
MRGDQATRGFWKGIGYAATDDTANVLDGLVVRHAGSARLPEATFQRASAIQLLYGSRLELGTVLVEEIAGYGLFAQRDNELQELGDVTVRNSQQPAYCYPATVQQFSGPVTFSGNDTDYVEVFQPNGEVPDSFTWPDVDVPYRVLLSDVGTYLEFGGDVVIEEGVEMHFVQDNGIIVREGGSMQVNGSVDGDGRTTVFRGEQATPGYWTGIRFDRTRATENVIDGAEIRHTGANGWLYIEPPNKSAVAATREGEATVRNCVIADYDGADFLTGPNAVLNASNNDVR